MKYGIAALSLFSKIIMIAYLTSKFVIPCSKFVIRFFRVSFSINLAAVQASGDAYMKLPMFGTLGRATVPAETGRHGGRPYDGARPKFLTCIIKQEFLQRLLADSMLRPDTLRIYAGLTCVYP